MKTTLMIDDVMLKKAKEQAVAHDTTVSEVVNRSLRAYLLGSQKAAGVSSTFSMPVFGQSRRRTTSASAAELAELRDDGR